jgi:hypothetical protein
MLGAIGAAGGGLLGLVLAVAVAVERGPIPAATVIAVFGAVVFTFAGVIYGALAGASVGALVGGFRGVCRSLRAGPSENNPDSPP